jgi:hypothetical protein
MEPAFLVSNRLASGNAYLMIDCLSRTADPDDVSHRYDTAELFMVIHNRDMSDLVMDHHFNEELEIIIEDSQDQVGAHMLPHQHPFFICPMAKDGPENIPFRDYPDGIPEVIDDYQRANTLLNHALHGLIKRPVGAYDSWPRFCFQQISCAHNKSLHLGFNTP